ncbi:hypothetical protein [Flavobacterium solisilvae]|jgi:hypothetical protein|uniref:Uncharacterized protein n=1 Tax=Flavobacterium solisilvae TaxID=1852019 RepID=A0ABX1QTG6_9FLAO|nr:hypothetical protein [Flavobacterium solisilvae]NMH25581.1 hypothetical protein [Flavobacterium solisilvae]
MEYLLAIVFLLLLLVIFCLANKIVIDRNKYKSKLKLLNQLINDLNSQQEMQNCQINISVEFRDRLNQIVNEINRDVFELSFQLFEENYQKKE